MIGKLYESIARRKSCQKFQEKPLGEAELNGLVDFLSALEAPVPEIDWNFDTLPYLDMVRICSTAPAVRAPVYLVLRAERKNFSLQNCGYLGELAALWLTDRGVATCWQGTAQVDPNEDFPGSLPYVTCLALGYGEGAFRAPGEVPERKSADKVIFNRTPEYEPILEAARLAPSSFNRQPWAFVSDDRQRLHLFRHKSLLANPVTEFHQCVDCGAALAHLQVAAEAKGFRPVFTRLKPEPSFKRGLVYQCSLELQIGPASPGSDLR